MSELGPSFYGEVLAVSSRAVDEEEDVEDCDTVSLRYPNKDADALII